MNNIIIGTAGHVDHGKTCLINALTGIDTDRLAEEKKRGITIELGFAYLNLPNGHRAGIIDVPGHERFIGNMLAGAGGIDVALLIVAADEGVMPQTREHVGILSLLAIKRGIIVITKADLADEDWLELVKDDIRDLTIDSFLEKAPIIAVSSYTGDGIEQLKQLILEEVLKTTAKNITTPFRLPVDRIFSMTGFGTVVTGTLIEGSIQTGEEVTIYPACRQARVRGVQVHTEKVDVAYAGQRVAINFANVKKEDLYRGCVVAKSNSMNTTMMIDVHLCSLSGHEREIKNGSRLHFYHGANQLLCKVVLLDKEILGLGEKCYAQLRFEKAVAIKQGDNFIIRFYSPIETIGGGTIIDCAPQKHKRNDPMIINALKRKHLGSPADKLGEKLHALSSKFLSIGQIGAQCGLYGDELSTCLQELLASGEAINIGKLYLHKAHLEILESRLVKLLIEYHKENPLKAGIKLQELRSKWLKGDSNADSLLDYFEQKGIIKQDALVSLSDFRIAFNAKQAQMRSELLAQYEASSFSPPELSALIKQYQKEKDFLKVHESLCDDGSLIQLDDELCLDSASYEKAYSQFKKIQDSTGAVTLAQFRDALATSRKYAVAILEYWDIRGITKKENDARTMVR